MFFKILDSQGQSPLARDRKIKVLHLGYAIAVVFILAACSPSVTGMPVPRPAALTEVETGRELIASYGCGSCHTIPGVPGADAVAGPPLDHFYQRSTIAGRLANIPENLTQWIETPQEIEPGSAMPDLGVTHEEAQAIAAFLHHKPSLLDIFRR